MRGPVSPPAPDRVKVLKELFLVNTFQNCALIYQNLPCPLKSWLRACVGVFFNGKGLLFQSVGILCQGVRVPCKDVEVPFKGVSYLSGCESAHSGSESVLYGYECIFRLWKCLFRYIKIFILFTFFSGNQVAKYNCSNHTIFW